LKFKDRHFERGENFFNMNNIATECNVSYNTVDKFLQWARKSEMLATRKTTRGIVIKVLKYAKYQDPDFYKSDTRSETEAKQKRNRSETIKEEGKNERMKEVSTNVDTQATKKINYNDKDFLIAKKLFAMLYNNNPAFNQKYKVLTAGEKTCWTWAVDIERLVRIDGATHEQIGFVIEWINSKDGEFWQSNIMSGRKLREKFTTIVGQMKRKPKTYGRETTVINF
jgi:DNA-binding transcriptional regulator YhcF (GntR family)